MILRLTHRTTFAYAGVAHDSFNEARLQPVSDELQTCRAFSLRISPAITPREYRDFYGNFVHYFDIAAPHRRLVIEAESEIETLPDAARPPVPDVPFAELASFPEREFFAEFLAPSRYVPDDVALRHEAVLALGTTRTTVFGDAVRIGRYIYQHFTYKPHTTGVSTRATDALRLHTGVCQDYAHVMLGLCRQSGIPARYVSGYFFNNRRRPGEIEASHAWVEVMVPGAGWIAYDPTHDRPADERYVKIATGRDYADIRPISGTYKGAPTRSLKVFVAVREADAALAAS